MAMLNYQKVSSLTPHQIDVYDEENHEVTCSSVPLCFFLFWVNFHARGTDLFENNSLQFSWRNPLNSQILLGLPSANLT